MSDKQNEANCPQDNTGVGIRLCIPSSRQEGEQKTFEAIIKAQKEKLDHQQAEIEKLKEKKCS